MLFLVSDNQAVGISLYQPSNPISGRINSPESLYTGLSFCMNTKGRVGNVSPSRGIYGSLLRGLVIILGGFYKNPFLLVVFK